jgi:hypothetical protein
MSCCSTPRDTGQPAYVSYGPSRSACAQDSSSAAK